MTARADTPPWWWLREPERRALGLGPAVRRTERGVLFGDEQAPLRLEIVPRTGEAPAHVGDVSLRLWGDARSAKAPVVLAAATRLIGARRGVGFDPDAAPWPSPDTPRGVDDRGASHGPTIVDVPSTCERACQFCHVSQRPLEGRTPRGDHDDVERAIDGATGAVLLTGDDALGSPRIVDHVARAGARGLRVSIIGPPRLGRTAALAPALARAGLKRWHTGIFGPDATLHDHVTGTPGAFDALLEAAAAMKAAGVELELLSLLVRDTLPALPEIVARAADLTSEPLTLLAYAPDSMVGESFGRVVPPYDELRAALERFDGSRARVDAMPLCALPEALRRDAGQHLERTDLRIGAEFPPDPCDGCAARARCPGVPGTVLRAVGTRGLARLATR